MIRRSTACIILMLIGGFGFAAQAAPEAPVMLRPGEQPPTEAPFGKWPSSPSLVGITSDRCPNWNSAKKVTSGFTITQDGAVLENYDVSGTVKVDAQNVTLRCFRVTGGRYGIQCGLTGASGCRSLVVEDSEVRQATSAGVLFFGSGTTSRPTTLRRSYVHHNTDNMKVTTSGVLVEDNYLGDMRDPDGGCHCDGIQYRAGNDVTFRRNYISGRRAQDSPYKAGQNATSATLNSPADGAINRFTLEDNYFFGGGYSVYLGCTGDQCMKDVHVRGNVWQRDSWSFGPLTTNVPWSSQCLVWEGNSYHDGGSFGGPGGSRSSGSCF